MKELNEKLKRNKFLKSRKGITLIALVITIIVILILAGVTIATLTGDNGLLKKSTKAKQANEEASALEKIQVEVAGSYGLDGKIDKTQLIKNLKNIEGIKYNNSEIDENTSISNFPAMVKLDEYAYTISENGSVNKVIEWIANSDGSFTNPEMKTTIKVGDIVHYETKLTANAVNNTKKAQLISDLGTYSGNTDSNLNTDSSIVRDSLTWKVLDVKDGKIRLISAVPTSSQIRLYGANAYNNLVYLLDNACDTLYSIGGVGTAQNLKIDDIEEKLSNAGKKARNDFTSNNVKYGEASDYSAYFPNIYLNEVGCKKINNTDNSGNTLGLSEQKEQITGSSETTKNLKITLTYWEKEMVTSDFSQSEYFSIFFRDNLNNNYSTYWLSSRCVFTSYWGAWFNVFRVKEGKINASSMFNNSGVSGGDVGGLRPVVSLEPSIQLSGDSTNGWTIR